MKVAYLYSKEMESSCSRLPCHLNRSTLVHSLIKAYRLFSHMDIISPPKATKAELCEYHDSDYIESLFLAQDLEYDCPHFDRFLDHIQYTSGASILAAQLIHDVDVCIHWDGGRHHAAR